MPGLTLKTRVPGDEVAQNLAGVVEVFAAKINAESLNVSAKNVGADGDAGRKVFGFRMRVLAEQSRRSAGKKEHDGEVCARQKPLR